MSVVAIVPAAGAGRRFGRGTPKAFVRLQGKPLLAHTLRVLQESPSVRWIVPVVRPEDLGRVRALLQRYHITKALPPCAGGPSREASVARGVAAAPRGARFVLVHDGARPCATPRLVEATIRAARREGAVACALPASVTVKTASRAGRVLKTLDRSRLWFLQTPQVFRRAWFEQALRRGQGRLAAFPDDAAVVEAAGRPVRLVAGDPVNIKVTTPEDVVMAAAVLTRRNGHGRR